MAEIVKIKKDGVIQYPITKPECVIDENGKNVLQLIKENGGGSTPDLSEYLTKEEFNRASEGFATADALEGKQDTIEDLDSIRSGAGKGATAVQPSTLTGYATTQQLTELSAEVSGLSEKVDALGEGGAQEILKVEYGKTTFQEIKDAFVAGKYIVFEYANNVFHINRVTDTEIYFVSINGTLGYRVGLNNKNNWYQNVCQNEQSTNKVTSLSSASTDNQYPSAKAVYDFVSNTLGTIINGDY